MALVFCNRGGLFLATCHCGKYGLEWGNWWSRPAGGPHGRALWKGIMLGVADFRRWVGFKVRDGSRVRFWKDIWCGDRSLEFRFPSLFWLVVDEDVLVLDYKEGEGSFIFWNVCLRCAL